MSVPFVAPNNREINIGTNNPKPLANEVTKEVEITFLRNFILFLLNLFFNLF